MFFCRLEELCDEIIDCPHSTPKWKNQGIPVIRNYNLNNVGIDLSKLSYVDEETYYKRIQRARPEAGDIIISREAPMGVVGMVPDNFKCCLGQRLVLLKVNKKKCNPLYLLYTLTSKFVQMQIQRINQTGSIVSNLNIPDLKKLIIPVIEKNQNKVSDLLNSITNKIDNNNKINYELEKMAKTIYDYWFLQFEFPNEEGKPYKSSGGKMVWNEELKREIPDRWKVKKIEETCTTLLGGTPNTKKEDFWNGNIPWLSSGELESSLVLQSEKKITEFGKENSATAFAPKGSVLLSITRYIRPAILGIDACFNQSVVAIIPNEQYHTAFLYPFLLSQVDRYMSLRTGAQQPHINKEIIDKTYIICVPDKVLKKYYEATEIIYDIWLNLEKENDELISLRGFLLPLLMNGQVSFME